MIGRTDVQDIRKKDGDYLLRKTESNGPVILDTGVNNAALVLGETRLALSVFWNGQVRHFLIMDSGGQVYFEEGGHREEDIEVRCHSFVLSALLNRLVFRHS